MKRFTSSFVQRMNREFVNIDVIVFGNRVKFIDSPTADDVLRLEKINGQPNYENAFKMAERSLQPSNARKVVLTITRISKGSLREEAEQVLDKMKADGFELYSMVLKTDGDVVSVDDFHSFTSRPLSRNSFVVHQSKAVDWSTVVAMETCKRRSS